MNWKQSLKKFRNKQKDFIKKLDDQFTLTHILKNEDEYNNIKLGSGTRSYEGQQIIYDSNTFPGQHNDHIYLGGGYVGGGTIQQTIPPVDHQAVRIAELEKELKEAKEQIRELEIELEEKVIVI